jgi:hypothetical protein
MAGSEKPAPRMPKTVRLPWVFVTFILAVFVTLGVGWAYLAHLQAGQSQLHKSVCDVSSGMADDYRRTAANPNAASTSRESASRIAQNWSDLRDQLKCGN